MLELGELLRTKNTDISFKNWTIESLTKKLERAEERINELEVENKLLEDALKDAEAELDKYKGGAVYVD
jgi:chromosome segregation ATPase